MRDLLPDRLPATRVLVFGYNARKKKHNSEMDFKDVATQLIAGVGRHRARPEVSLCVCGGKPKAVARVYLGRDATVLTCL